MTAKSNGMFDFLKSILETGEDLLTSPEAIKEYNPYIMNRWLMQYHDCVLIASEVSRIGLDDKRMHYDLLRAQIRKRRRYVKWVKAEPKPKEVAMIREYYNVDEAEALEYAAMIPAEHIAFIKKMLDNGGNSKHK